MRWTPRLIARVAAAGVVVIAMSLASGAESSASPQAADVTVRYSCPFPSGAQEVPVKITGSFPRSGTAGGPIRPSELTITPTLPQAALADLTKLDATAVTASADLSVTMTQHGASTKIAWAGLAAPATPIPSSGDLRLPASGMVPPASATAAGAAVFMAGPLTLGLTPHKADGSATDPAAIPLTCTLEPGQNAILAVVLVTGPNSATPPPGSGRATATPRTAQPNASDPCIVTVDLPPPSGSVPGEAFLAGFSNVKKLGGATLLGRENGQTTGHSTLVLSYRVLLNVCDGSLDLLSRGSLDDNGKPQFPPATATFLTFGFAPTTATIDLIQAPGTDIEIDSHSFPPDSTGFQRQQTTITSEFLIHISRATVDGTPLSVGPNCGTVTPLAVTLTGIFPAYSVNTGGPLTGTATIPPFSGCGVGENLDPIFTASISGPGNFMKLTQGVPCTRPPGQPPLNCDPIDRPIPQT